MNYKIVNMTLDQESTSTLENPDKIENIWSY